MSEIFPSRIREAAVAIGTATQWLFNFVFSQVTPHAVANLGWRTFLMFCIFNYALVVFAWFFIKETKGKSLEEMEACKSPGPCQSYREYAVLIILQCLDHLPLQLMLRRSIKRFGQSRAQLPSTKRTVNGRIRCSVWSCVLMQAIVQLAKS